MTEGAKVNFPSDSKIIVGTEHSKATGWYSLHLHDTLFAVSIRPEERRVVIDEGRGRGRLQQMRIPFENVLRFEAIKVPIGLDCSGAAADLPGYSDSKAVNRSFAPMMVRLLIKHTSRQDFISIHDVGATPLPVLIPRLRELFHERLNEGNISLNSAEDCIELGKSVIRWVRAVNVAIKNEEIVEIDLKRTEQREADTAYQILRNSCRNLDLSDLDVQQTLVSASAALIVAVYISNYRRKKKMIGLARATSLVSSFPLTLLRNQATNEIKSLTIEELSTTSHLYHKETGRPLREAIDTIAEHVSDLEKRRVTIDSSKDLSFLEENAPRHLNITDPSIMINEKGRVLSGIQLQHESQLRMVFKNEGVEVHCLKGLPFLSLLVKYETQDGETRHAVVIKDGLHKALKEFLLAHEMGHWFLHVKNNERAAQVDRYLRSSGTDNFLEKEANSFGMSVLFPPAYLADWVFLKKTDLSVDALLEEFTSGMESVGEKLKGEMRVFIGEHVEKYNAFKLAKEPAFLSIEIDSIDETKLDGLLALIHHARDSAYWVRLAKDSRIVDASDDCKDLFGVSKEQLKGTTPLELIIPEEEERMQLRAKYRMESKTAIYYFTEVKDRTNQTTHPVIVYSFPILSAGEYVGAMAALRPLDLSDPDRLAR